MASDQVGSKGVSEIYVNVESQIKATSQKGAVYLKGGTRHEVDLIKERTGLGWLGQVIYQTIAGLAGTIYLPAESGSHQYVKLRKSDLNRLGEQADTIANKLRISRYSGTADQLQNLEKKYAGMSIEVNGCVAGGEKTIPKEVRDYIDTEMKLKLRERRTGYFPVKSKNKTYMVEIKGNKITISEYLKNMSTFANGKTREEMSPLDPTLAAYILSRPDSLRSIYEFEIVSDPNLGVRVFVKPK